jgi:hypothetical protein
MTKDLATGVGGLGDRVGEEGRREWVADVVPLPIAIDEGDSPRPVSVLVIANGLVLHQEVLGRLAGEADAVAAALADGVTHAARSVGWYPETVIVRHSEVAAALQPALAAKDVEVRSDPSPPEIENVVRSLVDALGGHPIWPPVGRSETWRGWDLPNRLIGELFDAAARFYEAAPWRGMSNTQTPCATLPSGRQWTACVMGYEEEVFGLALYSDAADVVDLLTADSPNPGIESIRGRMISISYDPVAQLGPKARKELALARWRLAGPAAYPDLMTSNTPAGGVSGEDVRDLIVLLDALPRFAQAHSRQLEVEERTGVPCEPIQWTDATTGVALRYEVDEALLEVPPPGAVMAEEVRAIMREIEGEVGPGSSSDEVLAVVNTRLQARMDALNRRPHAELFGHSPVEVHRLLHADWSDDGGPLRLRRDLSLTELGGCAVIERVRVLLELAAERGGLGRTQAGNLQMAVVRELIGRAGLAEAWAVLADEATNRRHREHDVWPLHEARVLADLAGLVRPRGARFELTRRGRELMAPDRAGELFALLFETCFRRFNIFYGGYAEWPELQHQIAFTLLRLSRVGRRWQRADDLLETTILLAAMEAIPDSRGIIDGGWVFQQHVLRRLVDFGLVEHRPGKSRGAYEYQLAPLFDRFLSFEDAAEVD